MLQLPAQRCTRAFCSVVVLPAADRRRTQQQMQVLAEALERADQVDVVEIGQGGVNALR
jgi:hypothetical protein